MPHYDSYHSFQTKRSMEQKKRAKEKAFRSKKHLPRDFIILQAKEYGIVIEVRYHDASILYGGQVVLAKLRSDMNFACNQILLPGDKVVLNDYFIPTKERSDKVRGCRYGEKYCCEY